MNFLYISPQFPPNFKHFVFALRDAGARVLGVGDTPWHEVAEDLRSAMAEYWYIPDLYHRYDELKRATESLVAKYGKIDRVDSNNEHWLGHEAQLREDFDIFGQRPADLEKNRRKLGMKAVFKRAGVPVAPAELVTSIEQAREFCRKHGFPVVLKPDIGVGASGARKVSSEDELISALTPLPPNTAIESFVRGRIFTYDGMVDRDGRIMYESSLVYSTGIMEIVTNRLGIHYYSLRDIPEKLQKSGRACVKEFGIRERFFHFEFFETPGGEFWGLEVNVRPPGGYSVDMMNYSSDSDVYRAWARMMVLGETKMEFERKYYVAHVGRRAEERYRHGYDHIMYHLGVKFVHHPWMPELWRPVMGDDVYIIGDESLEKLEEAIEQIEQLA